MWNWENKAVGSVYYSRIIASWIVAMGKRGYMFDDTFKDWLGSIGLNEEQVNEVYEMATNGKLELEANARCYIKNHMTTEE